jgi:hypothetical protein
MEPVSSHTPLSQHMLTGTSAALSVVSVVAFTRIAPQMLHPARMKPSHLLFAMASVKGCCCNVAAVAIVANSLRRIL